ncbi:unnamed protein product [Pleuronectes platessa]|uniref:Uncharacterized protein n=1 Tax=Pleuronectes platessa TaxID=8262 RepID=A0A9N7TSC1_PLEPL|nr:unnamed protein product [Pleuronectes platessa]
MMVLKKMLMSKSKEDFIRDSRIFHESVLAEEGKRSRASSSVTPGCLLRGLTLTGRLPAPPSTSPRTLGPRMADAQQFFTGELYVPVHMLKLPAEELFWSALPRTTRGEEADS